MKNHREPALYFISLILFLLLAVGMDGAQRAARDYTGQFANPWPAIAVNSLGPLVFMAAALALAWAAFRWMLPFGLRVLLFLVGAFLAFFPFFYWSLGGVFIILARFPALAVASWPTALGIFSRLAGAFVLLVSLIRIKTGAEQN